MEVFEPVESITVHTNDMTIHEKDVTLVSFSGDMIQVQTYRHDHPREGCHPRQLQWRHDPGTNIPTWPSWFSSVRFRIQLDSELSQTAITLTQCCPGQHSVWLGAVPDSNTGPSNDPPHPPNFNSLSYTVILTQVWPPQVNGHAYDEERQFYIVQLGQTVQPGSYKLDIPFTGNLNNDLAGRLYLQILLTAVIHTVRGPVHLLGGFIKKLFCYFYAIVSTIVCVIWEWEVHRHNSGMDLGIYPEK